MTPDRLRVARARREAVSLARAILGGEVGVLEGALRMLPLRWTTGVDEWDADFLVFVGIHSQEDHLPVGPARAHWSDAALEAVDAEAREAETVHRPGAFAACESLIRRFAEPASPVLRRVGEVPADSDLHLLPWPLAARSLSDREIVLPYPEVLYALDHLEESGCETGDWEGWLRWPDGRMGHSARHQGTAWLGTVPRAEAFRLCRETIDEAQGEWMVRPERPGVELYFCLVAWGADDPGRIG